MSDKQELLESMSVEVVGGTYADINNIFRGHDDDRRTLSLSDVSGVYTVKTPVDGGFTQVDTYQLRIVKPGTAEMPQAIGDYFVSKVSTVQNAGGLDVNTVPTDTRVTYHGEVIGIGKVQQVAGETPTFKLVYTPQKEASAV